MREPENYTIVEEMRGYALLQSSDNRRNWTVVNIDWYRGQVYSAMPGDIPTDGGRWFARIGPAGVAHVSSWYSESWAKKIFSQLTGFRSIVPVVVENNFHNTAVTLHVKRGRRGRYYLSDWQVRRAKVTLCQSGCTCSDDLGRRGPQPGPYFVFDGYGWGLTSENER